MRDVDHRGAAAAERWGLDPYGVGAAAAAPDPAEVDLDTIDLCDLARFEHGFPHATFDLHRAVAPVEESL